MLDIVHEQQVAAMRPCHIVGWENRRLFVGLPLYFQGVSLCKAEDSGVLRVIGT